MLFKINKGLPVRAPVKLAISATLDENPAEKLTKVDEKSSFSLEVKALNDTDELFYGMNNGKIY